jgi:hypothetical protein
MNLASLRDQAQCCLIASKRAVGEIMNRAQRNLVIYALIGIGLVLSVLFLHWDDGIIFSGTPVFVLHKVRETFSNGQYVDRYWGVYTRFGTVGILLGVIAPLCLFVAAAFVGLGSKGSTD